MYLPNLKSVALPVPELIGGSPKFGAVPGYAHTLYSPEKILYADHTDYSTLCALVFPRFSIGVSGGGCEPQFWGKGGRRGSGMVPFERALVNFCRPSVVTFSLSLRVSEILPLLFSSMPLFPYPTSSLPKFPHVTLGIGGSPFGYKERRGWANCSCN